MGVFSDFFGKKKKEPQPTQGTNFQGKPNIDIPEEIKEVNGILKSLGSVMALQDLIHPETKELFGSYTVEKFFKNDGSTSFQIKSKISQKTHGIIKEHNGAVDMRRNIFDEYGSLKAVILQNVDCMGVELARSISFLGDNEVLGGIYLNRDPKEIEQVKFTQEGKVLPEIKQKIDISLAAADIATLDAINIMNFDTRGIKQEELETLQSMQKEESPIVRWDRVKEKIQESTKSEGLGKHISLTRNYNLTNLDTILETEGRRASGLSMIPDDVMRDMFGYRTTKTPQEEALDRRNYGRREDRDQQGDAGFDFLD